MTKTLVSALWSLWEEAGPDAAEILRVKIAKKLTSFADNRERRNGMYNKNVYKYDEMKRKEHMAVRETVGWYFWTHQLLEVSGSDGAAFLDKIYANPIGNLKAGRERYTTMLNEEGEIIDDVVVFRWEENKFWISTLFLNKLVKWFDAQKGTMDVKYEDITPRYDMYAVQGPKSRRYAQYDH